MKKLSKKYLDEYFAEARAYGNTGSPAELLKAASVKGKPSAALRLLPAGLLVAGLIAWPLVKNSGTEENRTQTDAVLPAPGESPAQTVQSMPEMRTTAEVTIKTPPVRIAASFREEEQKAGIGSEAIHVAEMQPAGAQLILMSASELKKLGLELQPDGILTWTYAPYRDARHVSVRFEETGRVSAPEAKTVEIREHFKHPFPSFVPARISDLSGTKEYFTRSGGLAGRLRHIERSLQCSDDESRDESAWREAPADAHGSSNYLPVRAGNFIVWFTPGEELLQALPEPVCNSVFAELDGREPAAHNTGSYPQERFCYLDLCEKNNGAISCSKVFPNPARERKAGVNYELSESRLVNISLFDLSGRKVRELAAPREHGRGRHEAEIPLEGIEKGIYLLVIGSDKGERLSRRLILE